MAYDVITIGSATVDVFVKTSSEDLIDIKTPSSEEKFTCYPLGSKILITDLQFMTGGGGTNTAVSFSRLGLKTAYLGNIGNDANGKKVIEELKKEKVDFIGTIGKEKTNYSIILDSIGHDRTILVYRDASEYLNFDKVKKNKLKAKWFYFSSMTGKSFDAAVKLMEFAKKNNIKIAYNPSEYQVREGAKKLKPLLEKTDALVFNRDEASILSGLRRDEPIEKIIKTIMHMGPKIVVVTDGPNELYCSDGASIYSLMPRRVKIVETTGAGDAFASAFVAALARGQGIEFALRLALVNSESVIQHYGAKNKLLTWNEAVKIMRGCPSVKRRKLS
ncbi:MAG: carbohydrate kinase family protein [Candidatus Woesearchaeota archaeon]|nr:carbohydrate kinase family protein [Candidatus Woesearchaeota archaeon]